MLPTAAAALTAFQKCFPLQPQHSWLCRHDSYCSRSTLSFAEMLPAAAAVLSAFQKCFPLQPQHPQLCRNASHCSRSTLSFSEMLPTAATALSALQTCFPLQPRHFQLNVTIFKYQSFAPSIFLHLFVRVFFMRMRFLCPGRGTPF